MNIIRSNYSNNSMALVQWASEQQLEDVTVIYIDTGWSAESWLDYVARCEAWVKEKGFEVVHIEPITPFEDVMEMKGGFPSRERQWCSLHLKGIPFLKWVEEVDPSDTATILTAKTTVDTNFTDIPEFIESCEYHGERRVWHPLHNCSREERDALLARGKIKPLPHRSLECCPCINSTMEELRNLSEADMDKTAELEEELEATLFRPEDCGNSEGICQVVEWAKHNSDDALNFKYGCSASFGCGT